MLKGAVFDLGETLIHITATWERVREARVRAIYETLREHRVTLSLDNLKREYMRLHDEESQYSEHTLEEIETGRSLTELLDRLKVEDKRRPPIADLVKKSYTLEVGSWLIFPGVEAMLQQIRDLGMRVGLCSNARSDWAVRDIVEQLNLARYFDSIVTSAAVGFRKPRPEPFQQILRLLGLQPNEAVMIGNSVEADVAGARSLGMKTIHVTYGDESEQGSVDPDATVSTVEDIIPAIRRLSLNS